MEEFGFKEVYGIVATDLQEGDPKGTIRVLCPEKSPFSSEDLQHKEEDVSFTTKDEWGTRTSSSCKTTNTMEAIYFGGNSNCSIPDVVVGEQVKLISHGNSNTHYWMPIRKDERLRKREHLRISCASDPTRDKQLGDDNTFFIEINTKQGKKKIHISTSQKDGETHRYDVLIDIEKGTASLNDELGNQFKIDSNATTVTMINKEGTKFQADKKNAFIFAPDSIYINATNKVVVQGTQLITNFTTGILSIAKIIAKYVSFSKG